MRPNLLGLTCFECLWVSKKEVLSRFMFKLITISIFCLIITGHCALICYMFRWWERHVTRITLLSSSLHIRRCEIIAIYMFWNFVQPPESNLTHLFWDCWHLLISSYRIWCVNLAEIRSDVITRPSSKKNRNTCASFASLNKFGSLAPKIPVL